jgi:HrpA-like RNA helicase
MASFPLDPCHARAILASKEYGCTADIIDIISVLSASSNFLLNATERESASERRNFQHPSGDHLTILNIVKTYHDSTQFETDGKRKEWCRIHFLNERTLMEATKIRDQLRKACSRLNLDWMARSSKDDMVLSSLGCGLIQNTALLQPDGTYKQAIGSLVSI